MTDNRKPFMVTLPHREVILSVEHPYEKRKFYYVNEMVHDENGKFAGWRSVSKGYAHSTSAFAALGRLVQKDINNRDDTVKE